MKANELRIGNWIDCKFIDEIIAISGIGEDGMIEFNNVGTCLIRYIKPIPLKGKWLEKCGFAENRAIIAVDNYYNACFERKNGHILFLTSYDNGKIGIPIKYVHRFQNLYFALTNKEVPIKT